MEDVKHVSGEEAGEMHRPYEMDLTDGERLGSAIAGSLLLAWALKKRGFFGGILSVGGGVLLYRAATGLFLCEKEISAGMATGLLHGRTVEIEDRVVVKRPPEQLYGFWRNVENLPLFMHPLELGEVIDGKRSRWIIRTPYGTALQWESEIYEEKENELIAWRSLPGSDFKNEGRVQFHRFSGGQVTEVALRFLYEPPCGKVGLAVARLFGQDPGEKIHKDLEMFRRLVESDSITLK